MRNTILPLALIVVAAGCYDPNAPDVSEFQRELAEWQALGIRDYQYELGVGCFCGVGPTDRVLVTAENGIVTSLVWADSLTPVPEWAEGHYISIDAMFERLRAAFDNDAHDINVLYDPQYHYPTSIWIDYAENIADEEVSYAASNLVARAY